MGILPEALREPETPVPADDTIPLQLEVGTPLKKDYATWKEAEALFEGRDFSAYAARGIPVTDYFDSRIIASAVRVLSRLDMHSSYRSQCADSGTAGMTLRQE